MNSRKALRIFGWSLGGLCLLVFLLLVSVYFILRTPSMQAKILQSIREPLAAAGLKTEIERLSIDLLGFVSLDGLDLKIEKAPLASGHVQLDQLRLRYALWPLLQRRLVISELSVTGVRGNLRLDLPPAEEPPPAEPLDLGALLEQLRHPPLTLDSPEIHLREVALDVFVKKGPLQATARVEGARLGVAMSLQPGQFDFSLDGALPLVLDLTVDAMTHVRSQLNLVLNPRFKLELEEKSARWELNWPELSLSLQDLALEKGGEAGQLALAWPTFAYQQSLSVKHEGPLPEEPAVDDLLWPLSLTLEQGLKASALSLRQTPPPAARGSKAKGKKAEPGTPAAGPLELRVQPQLSNRMEATLPSLQSLETAAWSLATSLALENIFVQQGTALMLRSPSLSLSLKGEGQDGKGTLNSTLGGAKLESSLLKTSLDLSQNLAVQLNLVQKQIALDLSQRLNGLDLLTLRLDASDPQDKELQAKLTLQLKTDPRLVALHAGAAILPQLGYPQLAIEQNLQLNHPMPLFAIKGSDLKQLTITNSLSGIIEQSDKTGPLLAGFKNIHLEEKASWEAEQLSLDLKVQAEQLAHSALLRPVDVIQTLTVSGSGGERLKGSLQAATRLGSAELLSFKATLEDLVGKALIASELLLEAQPELQKELAALKILSDTGPLKIAGTQNVSIEHGADSLQKLAGFDLKKINIDAQLEQTITSLPYKGTVKYKLLEPLHIETRARLIGGRGDLNTRVFGPAVEAIDLARVKDLKVGIIASLSDLETMATAEAKVVAQIAQVDLQGELAKKPELKGLLRQIQVILHATLERKELLHIKNLFASLQHPFVQFRGSGDVALSGRGDFKGKLDVVMPEEAKAGVKGKGRFALPLQITLYDKQKIALKAEPRFQAFSLEFGDLNVQNVQGSLQITEELSLDQKGKIGFLYLNTQNPFVRVDYESVEPYVGNASQLSIEKIRFKHIELGPLVENFEVRQNLVYLNDFKADLLGGSALGRLYFDLHPDRLQLGFLGRFSQLQPELLKEPERRRAKDQDVLSGRMGSSFDIRQRLASGRIDITTIGRQQLSSLLDVLDPEYKDSQIATARRAIQVAYPRFVAISMNQGLMDLTIGLGGAISKDIYIRSIPLSALINAHLGTTLQKIETLVQEGES